MISCSLQRAASLSALLLTMLWLWALYGPRPLRYSNSFTACLSQLSVPSATTLTQRDDRTAYYRHHTSAHTLCEHLNVATFAHSFKNASSTLMRMREAFLRAHFCFSTFIRGRSSSCSFFCKFQVAHLVRRPCVNAEPEDDFLSNCTFCPTRRALCNAESAR